MTIDIFNSKFIPTKVTNLTWLQKLICKWFKIEPAVRYHYRILINDHCRTGLMSNQVVIGFDGTQLLVLDENTLVTTTPLLQQPVIGGKMVVIGGVFPEGSAMPQSTNPPELTRK